MVRVLGSPTEVLRRRKTQLENLKSIDQQIQALGQVEAMEEDKQKDEPRRSAICKGGR